MADDARVPAIRPLKFWTNWVNDPARPGEKKGDDWVLWVKLGEGLAPTTQEKIARLKRQNSRGETMAEWTVIEPYYKAWKEGNEPPETGTPLAAWPGATEQLVEALKDRRIKTVQEFADMPDHEMSKLPVQNVRFLWNTAKNFLEAQKGASAMEAELSKRDAEIDALKAQMAALVARAEEAPAEPKRRGRPPKADAEAEVDAA